MANEPTALLILLGLTEDEVRGIAEYIRGQAAARNRFIQQAADRHGVSAGASQVAALVLAELRATITVDEEAELEIF